MSNRHFWPAALCPPWQRRSRAVSVRGSAPIDTCLSSRERNARAFHPIPGRRLPAIIAATAATCLVAAGSWFASSAASAGTVSGTLYRDPSSQVMAWVAANPGDSRMPVIRDKIASQPQARWLSSFNPATVQSEVSGFISAANAAGQIPVLSVYEITNRDCGGASAGGAPNLTQYQTWISSFAQALGSQTVMIILETDSLALQTCLSGVDAHRAQPGPEHRDPDHQGRATPTPRCTSTAGTPHGTAPRCRPPGCGTPACSTRTASSPTSRTSTAPPTRPPTAGRSSPPSTALASPARPRSSTPAATAAPAVTGARTTTPTGASGSTRP